MVDFELMHGDFELLVHQGPLHVLCVLSNLFCGTPQMLF
jgi:hypothetical protein